ncbi:hypothetical protein [Streptosporangium sp. NPDC000396]|uniref:hypothetical protein n=1 Tax=Streptosporangium sp. NPDC000396 TaxID=3366185 RepID=UPI0036B5D360
MIATAVVPAGASLAAASASSANVPERACSRDGDICNITWGNGAYVDFVEAQRGGPLLGRTGFFEVFARNNWKKTDITTPDPVRFINIGRNFAQGELICLRFFQRNSDGSFTQKSGNVCTSIPIG